MISWEGVNVTSGSVADNFLEGEVDGVNMEGVVGWLLSMNSKFERLEDGRVLDGAWTLVGIGNVKPLVTVGF